MQRTTALLAVPLIMSLAGCAPVAVTALGVGMATGVSHQLGGIVYKTFTTPQADVRRATVSALNRMQVKVTQSKRDGMSDVILGRAGDREIEVELEALTPATTRMVVTARKDGWLLRDSATATEIILQTEKILNPA